MILRMQSFFLLYPLGGPEQQAGKERVVKSMVAQAQGHRVRIPDEEKVKKTTKERVVKSMVVKPRDIECASPSNAVCAIASRVYGDHGALDPHVAPRH